MQFTDEDLREFMRIWQEEFHEAITLDEARHSASMLMELYTLLIQTLPEASLRSWERSLPDHRT